MIKFNPIYYVCIYCIYKKYLLTIFEYAVYSFYIYIYSLTIRICECCPKFSTPIFTLTGRKILFFKKKLVKFGRLSYMQTLISCVTFGNPLSFRFRFWLVGWKCPDTVLLLPLLLLLQWALWPNHQAFLILLPLLQGRYEWCPPQQGCNKCANWRTTCSDDT